jgi:hypothetical protein
MSSLCVCLCIYKSENGLPYVLANLHTIHNSRLFGRLKVIAIHEKYDGAGTGTGDNYTTEYSLLTSFANHLPPNSLEIIQNQYPTTPVRQRNIGNARNTFLNRMRVLRDEKNETYDHFAMMDTNDYACIGPVCVDTLREAMACSDKWDSLSFLREAQYYDIWALSFDPYIHSFFHFNRSWYEVRDEMRAAFNAYIAGYEDRALDEKMLIPVYSAFNGFALYRSSIYVYASSMLPELRYSDEIDVGFYPSDVLKKQTQLLGCNTDGRINDDCEHRYFHMASMQPPHNARIFIYAMSLFAKMQDRDRPSRFASRALI